MSSRRWGNPSDVSMTFQTRGGHTQTTVTLHKNICWDAILDIQRVKKGHFCPYRLDVCQCNFHSLVYYNLQRSECVLVCEEDELSQCNHQRCQTRITKLWRQGTKGKQEARTHPWNWHSVCELLVYIHTRVFWKIPWACVWMLNIIDLLFYLFSSYMLNMLTISACVQGQILLRSINFILNKCLIHLTLQPIHANAMLVTR